jgi:xanthine dehydrogenase YagR molybdenum-binding subunit
MKAGLPQAPVDLEVTVAEGDLRPWDLDSKLSVVKGRHPRLDGPLKVTGRAKYTYDISMPGMLWGRMVRAPIPAGEIKGIDTSAAEALPGVKAVWTTESRYVRFAGQDIAAVAAVSPEVAEDAARLVKVAYDEKPFVTDLREAMKDGAPPVYDPSQLPPDTDKSKVRGNVIGPNTPRRGGGRGDVA